MSKNPKLDKEIAELEKRLAADTKALEAAKTKREALAKAKTLTPAEHDAKIAQIKGLLKELEDNAEATGQGFSFSVAYGMGGTFEPDERDISVCGWVSSSERC